MHRLLDSDAGALPASADTREEPFFIAMKGPEFAQTPEHLRRDGHLACLVDFGLGDVNDEPLAFDVLGFDVDGLAQSQSTLIDERAIGTVASIAEGAQEAVDFLAGENIG